MKIKKLKIKNSTQGFTLAELMVTLAIITVMISITLGSRNKYTERLALKSEMYNVALAIRKAQVYSLGVKGFNNGSNPTTFDTSYGVSFDSGIVSSITFFTDENVDRDLDSSEYKEILPIENKITIEKVCSMLSGVETCSPFGLISRIDVTFNRPSPNARVKVMNSSGTELPNTAAPIKIYFVNQSGTSSFIQVDYTGGVSVQM